MISAQGIAMVFLLLCCIAFAKNILQVAIWLFMSGCLLVGRLATRKRPT